jgi:hypothetical protein
VSAIGILKVVWSFVCVRDEIATEQSHGIRIDCSIGYEVDSGGVAGLCCYTNAKMQS